jgi:hypothetical protein
MSRQSAKPGRDADLVAWIVEELEKGGTLKDPRHPEDRRTSLADHVRYEVQRSLNSVRLLQTFKWPDHVPPLPTAADYRKAAQALRKVAFTEAQRTAIRELEAVRVLPPERMNALKYQCAAEAFDLMTFFSAKPPTGTERGPFRTIAVLLCEAVTGQRHDKIDMKRACGAVLRDRRKYNPNAFIAAN